MPDIQLITFDLDNTLWDVHSVIRDAEQAMRDWLDEQVPEYSATITPDKILTIRNRILTNQPQLAHDVSTLRKTVLFEAISVSGYGNASARRLAEAAFSVFFEARQQVVFFPGALDTLALLAGEYRLGALTNGNANIEAVGLAEYFSFAYSSADVGVSKPAPDMFHAALRHAGVDAAGTIHVGDNLVDDIAGAAQLGIHTIWTNHEDGSSDDASHPPSEIVDHLEDLPKAVDAIRAY